MSFPPNLGITTSFLIDPTGSLLIQDLPSLLPQLEQLCSPFSKHRMNGYSRIKKHTTARSKSIDFADLSLAHHARRSLPKLQPQETRPNLRITTMHDSIPEQDNEDEAGEVFGIILSRKCSVPQEVRPIQESSVLQKSSFPVQRSASVSESYSRIHHQSDIDTAAEEDEISSLNTNARRKKKAQEYHLNQQPQNSHLGKNDHQDISSQHQQSTK